jgi:phenylpropionate dioxygenase-like ring-hydroxylating dioxygenase large terminal subunit
MSNALLRDVLGQLRSRIASGQPTLADDVMTLPASYYRDAAQWEREMRAIFLELPLLVALSCDIPEPGDYLTFVLAGRPLLVVRGDDGRARTLLNVCRHRAAIVATEPCGNARRFTCPYHAWSYDRSGALDAVPGRNLFGAVDAEGLLAFPTREFAGAIFAVLDPDASFDAADWLGGMGDSLAALELDRMHAYRPISKLDSPNWKLAADGYVDGYHLPYLHRESIGGKILPNGHAYDLFGPHVRLTMATRRIDEIERRPSADGYLPDFMSLVHFIFPNVSISGGHGDTAMLSRLLPGPTPDRSTTLQYQYFRKPLDTEGLDLAERKRIAYEQVVRTEDYATVFGIGTALEALGDRPVVFGRNELGNQHLHRTIARFTGASNDGSLRA